MSPLASLTVVSVLGPELDGDVFGRFAAVLEPLVTDFNFILVANAVPASVALKLKALVETVPDITVVFLGEEVHDDVARLVGIDHAVGDFVLLCDLGQDAPALLPRLLEQLQAGYDLVVADPPEMAASAHGRIRRVLFPAYARAYAAMAGLELDQRPTGLRALSRAAALFISGRPNAELALRARSIGAGFPATSVAVPFRAASRSRRSYSWTHGIGMLLSVSTVPLRAASYMALFGGALSVLYSLYVVATYAFKRDVAAGWATISLQIAAMMFVFSLVLLLISEYIIQIHSASPPRSRRYLVVRELRSPLSRRSLRLNVVDAEGRFRLGRPDSADPVPGVSA